MTWSNIINKAIIPPHLWRIDKKDQVIAHLLNLKPPRGYVLEPYQEFQNWAVFVGYIPRPTDTQKFAIQLNNSQVAGR